MRVGELGIDMYWDKSTLRYSKESTGKTNGMGIRTKLSIIIHSRDATQIIIEIIKSIRG